MLDDDLNLNFEAEIFHGPRSPTIRHQDTGRIVLSSHNYSLNSLFILRRATRELTKPGAMFNMQSKFDGNTTTQSSPLRDSSVNRGSE